MVKYIIDSYNNLSKILTVFIFFNQIFFKGGEADEITEIC